MSIKYKNDPNLIFLQNCDNMDLKVLVKYLTKDIDGISRYSEELTSEKRYKKCKGNYVKIWDLIAGELQLFGGDSIRNLIRGGKGVKYKVILRDVCDKLKVKYKKKSKVDKIEKKLLMKVVKDSLQKMTPKQRKNITKKFHIDLTNVSVAGIMAALQFAVKSGGFESYRIAVIVANGVSKAIFNRGLALTTNAALTKAISIFSGPIGLAVSIILLIPAFTGPAYRVTIPAILHIAYMRQKYLYEHIEEKLN